MGFLMTACGDSSLVQNEAAMNTIQPYSLSDEDSEMVSLVAPSAEDAITQFAVDETYQRVCIGFDYYERGKLVKENDAKCEFPFTYDSGPKDSYGKICTFIDDDNIVINIYGKAYDKSGKLAEADGLGSKEPFSNEHLTLDDVNTISISMLDGPVDIEKNKKIYIYATIGDNDDDLEVADISTLMEDKKLLSSYDKCFVFYAIFK
jgi:hypothetical protein